MSHKESSNFLPIFINIAGKDVLVVGAGRVAHRKIEVLLKYNLSITVVASEICKEINDLALVNKGKIILNKESFSDDCLEKKAYSVVFAATNDPELNDKIACDCIKLGILCNNVTSTDSCSFIMPAIIKEEDVQIAVSTSGKAPCVSKFLKTELENTFLPEVTSYIPLIEKIRSCLKENQNINEELKLKVYEKVLKSKKLMARLNEDESNLQEALNLLLEELK